MQGGLSEIKIKQSLGRGTRPTKKDFWFVDFNIKGRIIYVEIKFDENITLDNAKKLVENSMSLFDEDTLSYYDVQFIIQSDNFTIMASKNSAAENISWNNNTPIEALWGMALKHLVSIDDIIDKTKMNEFPSDEVLNENLEIYRK
jgi:hypothetical protein